MFIGANLVLMCIQIDLCLCEEQIEPDKIHFLEKMLLLLCPVLLM